VIMAMRIVMDLHDDAGDAGKQGWRGVEKDRVFGAFAVEFEQVEVGDVIGGQCVG